MAILLNDVEARADFVATLGQTVFAFDFRFFDNADLQVYRDGVQVELDTDYTVAGAAATSGMQITLIDPAALAEQIAIVRAVPYERDTQLPLSGPFQVESLNLYLTKLAAMVQQLRDQIARTPRLPVSDVDGDGAYEAGGNRLSGLAEAVEATDAITKGYADTNLGGAASAAAAAAAADALDSAELAMLLAAAAAQSADEAAAAADFNPDLYPTKANNLSDLASAAMARTNLGLHAVAESGSYNDLEDLPTLFSGSYNDLADKPTADPCRLVQTYFTSNVANTNLTAQIPGDDTVPLITEGTQILSQAVTVAGSQFVRGRISLEATATGGTVLGIAVFRDGTCIAARPGSISAGLSHYVVDFIDTPGAGSPVYTVRIGPAAAVTVRLNGTTAGRYYGGASAATLSLDVLEPA